jgi:hypothetical protein
MKEQGTERVIGEDKTDHRKKFIVLNISTVEHILQTKR